MATPVPLATLSTAPEAMPSEIQDFLDRNNWGTHHLEWHTTRQWDRLGRDGQRWAQQQGWSRAPRQEGQLNNGLEFLVMHHVMFETLKKLFPARAEYFQDWKPVPRAPNDALWPVLDRARWSEIPEPMTHALDVLVNRVNTPQQAGLLYFTSQDQLGLYIQTTVRGPGAGAPQRTAGLHNYLHGRFSRDGSDIDMGDPAVNMKNTYFWKLHGFVEEAWLTYRELQGLPAVDADNDPLLQQYLRESAAHLPFSETPTAEHMHATPAAPAAAAALVDLRKLAKRNFNQDVAAATAKKGDGL